MISAWWLLLIVPVAAIIGLFAAALCRISSEVDNKDSKRLAGPDSDRRRHS